eukprot:427763_1
MVSLKQCPKRKENKVGFCLHLIMVLFVVFENVFMMGIIMNNIGYPNVFWKQYPKINEYRIWYYLEMIMVLFIIIDNAIMIASIMVNIRKNYNSVWIWMLFILFINDILLCDIFSLFDFLLYFGYEVDKAFKSEIFKLLHLLHSNSKCKFDMIILLLQKMHFFLSVFDILMFVVIFVVFGLFLGLMVWFQFNEFFKSNDEICFLL